MRHLARRGFTLLELMVAATLVAIMSSAVVVLVGRGLTAWQRADTRLQQLFQAQKAFQRLAEDLRHATPIADQAFVGKEAGLNFIRAESPEWLAQVAYRVEERAGERVLVRERGEYPPSRNQESEATVLLHHLRSFSLAYPVRQDEGGRKLLDWQPVWTDPEGSRGVPELVRVTVELDDPKGGTLSLTREVWIPHGTLAVLPRG